MQRAAGAVMLMTALVSGASTAQSPTTRVGDSSTVAEIDRQTRSIYDSTQAWVFAFTRANLLEYPGAYGTEVQGGVRNGEIVRIIAGGWGPDGKFGVEYYLVNRELVFVYEGVERFQEVSGTGWQNFKGNRGWERRTYIRNGRATYVETTGEGAPPVAVEQLRHSVRRVLAVLANQPKPRG